MSRTMRRLVSAVASLTLLVAAFALVPASDAGAQDNDQGTFLAYSTNLDRSDAAPIDGAGVPADQDLAVTLVTDNNAVDIVVFLVDNDVVNVDFSAPFDLTGTDGNGDALPSQFTSGDYNIKAVVIADGNIAVEDADFTAEELPSILDIATDAGLTELIGAVLVASDGEIDFASAVADCGSDLTVFAPTNEAFQAIAEIAGALSLEDLQTVIASHVLGGAQGSAALLEASPVSTLAEQTLEISAVDVEEGVEVTITGFGSSATVLALDIPACNGVVHVIDTVLIPELAPVELPSILDIAVEAELTNLVDAVVAASGGEIDFAAAVSDCASDLTVFAPTNAAFEAIAQVAEGLTIEQLETVIAYHVLGGAQSSGAIVEAEFLQTLAGQPLQAVVNGAGEVVELDIVGANSTATVVMGDIEACNGIVHVIDAVLIPDLPPADSIVADGNTVLLRNVDRDRYLDADPNGGVDLGVSVELDNEWTFQAVGDGTWRLINGEFGQFLDADSPAKNYDVNLNADPNGYGVEWEIEDQGDGTFTLRAVDLNRYLDGDANGTVDTSFSVSADDYWEITFVDDGGIIDELEVN